MKLPKENFKVKVGPYWYEVRWSEDVGRESDTFGSCHHSDLKIFIDPSYNQQQREQTFLHEVMHACMYVSGLGHRFSSDDPKSRPNEEDTVRELSTVFFQFINDNKQFFK